jgi:uncharacterized membrane protein
MFRRHSPEGSWLYPLLGSLAVFVFVAIAVYVLTSMWRERTAEMTGEQEETDTDTDAPAPAPTTLLELTPIEILDRRLAAGEVTIEQYDELTAVLNRRFTASTWTSPEQAAAA